MEIPIVLNKRTPDKLENGEPKIITPEKLLYGEIAINYAQGAETIMFKNTADEIVTLPINLGVRVTELENAVSGSSEYIDTELMPLAQEIHNNLTI